MFRKLAKLPRLEPAIFQELLQLISLSHTLIQENGVDLFWNSLFYKSTWYVRIKFFVWNLRTVLNTKNSFFGQFCLGLA